MASEETEAAEIAEAEQRGDPYLLYRDAGGRQRILTLPDTWDRATVGRGLSSDVVLSWDSDVSRLHAELQRLGDEWVVVDDGLSRNGTFVGGSRVEGRRVLRDGDELVVGKTSIRFQAPFQIGDETRVSTKIDHPPQEPAG